MLLIPLVAFALVFGLPMASYLLSAFVDGGGVTLRHFVKYFGDPYNLKVLLNTLRVATLVTLATILLGVPFAVCMHRSTPRAQRWLLFAVVVPFAVSVIVKCLGWQILFRGTGPVNQALLTLGIIDEPIRLLLTETALVVGASSILLPFVIVPVFAALSSHPPEIDHAAATLGAAPMVRFFKVTLPLALPGIVAGGALVFAQAAAAYVIPMMLSGERLPLVSKQIVNAVGVLDTPQLGAVASITILVTLALILLATERVAKRVTDPAGGAPCER